MTKATFINASEIAARVGLRWPIEDQRQTGRTTRTILLALDYASAGNQVRFCAPTLRQGKWITESAKIIATKAGIDPNAIRPPTVPSHSRSFANDGIAVFHDHTCSDAAHI